VQEKPATSEYPSPVSKRQIDRTVVVDDEVPASTTGGKKDALVYELRGLITVGLASSCILINPEKEKFGFGVCISDVNIWRILNASDLYVKVKSS
jgi:hypothetical protein